jgi:hypothetical protein
MRITASGDGAHATKEQLGRAVGREQLRGEGDIVGVKGKADRPLGLAVGRIPAGSADLDVPLPRAVVARPLRAHRCGELGVEPVRLTAEVERRNHGNGLSQRSQRRTCLGRRAGRGGREKRHRECAERGGIAKRLLKGRRERGDNLGVEVVREVGVCAVGGGCRRQRAGVIA